MPPRSQAPEDATKDKDGRNLRPRKTDTHVLTSPSPQTPQPESIPKGLRKIGRKGLENKFNTPQVLASLVDHELSPPGTDVVDKKEWAINQLLGHKKDLDRAGEL